MFAIFNRHNERLYQFGTFSFRNDAYRVLRKAIENLPNSGAHIKQIDENKEAEWKKN